MLNIYIYKRIENLAHIPLLDFYFGPTNLGVARPGDTAIKLLNKKFFNLVEDPTTADYFLLPHNYFYIKDKKYINDFELLAQKNNKKILIFSYGDSDADIIMPNSIVFRTSQYLYKIKKNELIMPAIADDLFVGEVSYRQKGDKALVGFCGWAGYENPKRHMIEKIKSMLILFKAKFINKNFFFHDRGIIFRIRAIKYLSQSSLILNNFIIRKTFSGNEKTRKVDPIVAKNEYIQNILNSDISLAVKGDGNFSIRFYEILSLGRIPLFVDTNCRLPLEDVINYDDFMFKIDARNIKNIASIVRDLYNRTSDDHFVEMQKNARLTFEEYLRVDRYFDFVLSTDFLKKYE